MDKLFLGTLTGNRKIQTLIFGRKILLSLKLLYRNTNSKLKGKKDTVSEGLIFTNFIFIFKVLFWLGQSIVCLKNVI
jgi:hypothetical protein